MTVEQASSQTSLAVLIDAYCRRVCPAVLEQQEADSISSPLGVWLLLAACASAAADNDRTALEDALGCSSAHAAKLLASFLAEPPPALRSGLALWVRDAEVTEALTRWSADLPAQVERGEIPSQAAADRWVDKQTLGLIKRFPVEITELTRLLLTSVLATRVSWQDPFEVVPATAHLRRSSPWQGRVTRVLLDRGWRPPPMMLAKTEAAGVVAVHFALATEELAVLSVAADPLIDRRLVFEAAYEIARLCREDAMGTAHCSLFDVPLGSGHSWEVTEHEVVAQVAGGRSERIQGAVLVAWKMENTLDLQASDAFGVQPILSALLALIGPDPRGDILDAVQSAVASYTPTGFEAAAVSAMDIMALGIDRREEKGVGRTAHLYFDHPYAVVALAGRTSDFTRARAGHTELFCLPLFSAWVNTPHDAEPTNPA